MNFQKEHAKPTPVFTEEERVNNITQKRTIKEPDGQATKRQKCVSENKTIENKSPEGKEVDLAPQIHAHWSSSEVEQLLEKPRRQQERTHNHSVNFLENKYNSSLNTMESKYRASLHKIETAKSKTVNELRTENFVLKNNISGLEKVNHNLQKTRHNQFDLAKVQYDLRRKKFPWLRTHSLEEQHKETKFTNLPADLALKILSCLSEDDLFLFRGLNSVFYEAFYSQAYVSANIMRCIWLANKGRVFPNLLKFSGKNYWLEEDFRVVDSFHFPSVEALSLLTCSDENIHVGKLQSLGNLRYLSFDLRHPEDLKFLTEDKFPALVYLEIWYSFYPAWWESPNILKHLNNHKSLWKIEIGHRLPTIEEIKELSKKKFPSLEFVIIARPYPEAAEAREYLKQQGIYLEANP